MYVAPNRKIYKPEEFEEKILPRYFRGSKYSSFMRQVHFWGFRRIFSGTDKGFYYHKDFIRDQPELCANIARKKNSSSLEIAGDNDVGIFNRDNPVSGIHDELSFPPKEGHHSQYLQSNLSQRNLSLFNPNDGALNQMQTTLNQREIQSQGKKIW